MPKNAPYSNILLQYQKSNIKINDAIYLFCGKDAWKESKSHMSLGQLALCLPPKESPNDYDWPVNDLKIIIYDTGDMSEQDLDILVLVLLRNNAKQVVIFSFSFPMEIYTND